MTAKMHQIGYFGNIWVRENRLEKIGDTNQGHYHKFDHVTLLVRGRVEIEIEGFPSKQFESPTFIVIKKEYSHKFTALTDDCVWYCVFALRNVHGDVTDIYSGDNSPYEGVSPLHWENTSKDLENKTVLPESP